MSLKNILGINPEFIRIREFELQGQKFKVKVPNITESEYMEKLVENPSTELINEKYQKLLKPLLEKKEQFGESDKIVFKDDDVVIDSISLKEIAINQCKTELRILASFKLLIPQEGQTMDNLTYDDINSDIPFPIQLDIVKKIANIISPSYEDSKKN